jgi:inosose dehydratase
MATPERPLIVFLDALDQHVDRELFMIGEQDLYPCEPDVPLPIARRTYEYLRKVGVGSGEGSS